MSVLDSTFPNRNHPALQKKVSTGLLDLNIVLKESLKKAQTQVDNLQLIARCEALPHVKSDYAEMVKLFDDLLTMIMNTPPQASRLFLYVDCEEDSTDFIDMNSTEGFRRYTIKFHTNITTHENWKLINSQTLVGCKQILSKHNANLAVNEISKTGCVFSISLQGKIE
jgi:hypothetical protein